LRLTDTGANEAGSAWASTPINIQSFTNDFSFQLSNASGDGFTFTIQGTGTTALGPLGGGLGYGPDQPGGTPGIGKSVAIKFDLYSNAGEGTDSTGMYTNGASPTVPAIDMTSSGVVLLSGDIFKVHMTYDGTTLKWTVTDANNPSQTFTTSQAINIPSTVGGNTALVGFTGGTGGATAIQEIINWTYASSLPVAATPVFSPGTGVYNPGQKVSLSDSTVGSSIFYTIAGSTQQYTAPIVVNATTTISAFATVSGGVNSATTSATYTISSNSPIVFEATALPVTGKPNHRVFTWGGLPDKMGVVADGTKLGAFLSFTVNIAQAGTYDIKFGSKQYLNRAIVQLSVNGSNVGAPIDEYDPNPKAKFAELPAGTLTFNAAGNYTVVLTAVGKNAASSNYTVDTDYFKLTPQ